MHIDYFLERMETIPVPLVLINHPNQPVFLTLLCSEGPAECSGMGGPKAKYYNKSVN